MDAWRLTSLILYLIIIILFIVLIYLLVQNHEALYKRLNINKYWKKIIAPKLDYVTNDNDKQLQTSNNFFAIEIDDDGNISSDINTTIKYLCYMIAGEESMQYLALLSEYISLLQIEVATFKALYQLLPVLLYKKDFMMNSNQSEIYSSIIDSVCKIMSKDVNTANLYTIILMFIILEYSVSNVDINENFLKAVTHVNSVTILDQDNSIVDNDLTARYLMGNLATVTDDEYSSMAEYVPLLYLIWLYGPKYGFSEVNDIPSNYSYLSTTWRRSFFTTSMVYDPLLTSNGNISSWASINLALMIQSMYSPFTKEEVTKMITYQHFIEPSNFTQADVIVPNNIPITNKPFDGDKNLNNIDKKYIIHNLDTIRLSLVLPKEGDNIAAYDFDYGTNINDTLQNFKSFNLKQMESINNEGVIYQTRIGLSDSFNVGFLKVGTSTFREGGNYELFSISGENSISTLQLWSDLSFTSDGNNIEYNWFSLISNSFPEIIAPQDQINKTEENEYIVSPNSTFMIISRFNGETKKYSCWISSKTKINIMYENGMYTVTLVALTYTPIMLQDQTSDVEYKYVATTIAVCDYLPVLIPKMYISQLEKATAIVRYNDFKGINRINLMTSALAKNLFINLNTSPTLPLESRQKLLLIDNLNLAHTGMIISDSNQIDVSLIQNKQVKILQDKTMVAKGFSIEMII